MDKLTIEEKAKRYDEALKRANVAHKDEDRHLKATLERVFPELKESEDEDEDERIRKELIDIVAKSPITFAFEDKEKVLAWLEKQKVLTTEEDLQGKEDVLWCIKQAKKYAKNENEMGTCWFAEKWLEKQGEQNPIMAKSPQLGEQKPAISDDALREGIARFGITQYQIDNWLKKYVDVEQKFKVGDFIVNDYCSGKVIKITDDAYLLDTGQGIPFSCEHNAHLWDITKDARDGDVLADGVGVILFKSIGDNNVINYHAYLSGLFATQEGEQYWGHIRDCTLSPATKEQRERFFAAMHDAGYEWDAEKKELKKISQRMISAEAKEAMYGKPAWSKEDENEVAILEAYIRSGEWSESHIDRALGIVDELVNKVKSLKPQKHWKPNDTELEVLRLVAEKDGTCLMGLYEQLKKLREE